jgi:hypothetical protein
MRQIRLRGATWTRSKRVSKKREPASRQDGNPLPIAVRRLRVATAIGAVTFGALALSATAIAALAIGRLTVGAHVLKRGRVRSLVVDTLEVRRLHRWGQDNPAARQMFTSLIVPDATHEEMRWFNWKLRVWPHVLVLGQRERHHRRQPARAMHLGAWHSRLLRLSRYDPNS